MNMPWLMAYGKAQKKSLKRYISPLETLFSAPSGHVVSWVPPEGQGYVIDFVTDYLKWVAFNY
jgi:hypothetical protein